MNTEILEEIGMDENEAKIYIALLRLAASSATELSRQTKIERTAVYRIIERMIDSGLVTFVTENKVKKFRAVKPEKLLIHLREREEMLKEFLPELKKVPKQEKEPEIEIYRGLKGIKSMIRDILKLKKDSFVIIGDKQAKGLEQFFRIFVRLVEKEGIRERLLIKEGTDILKSRNTKIRYLPKEYNIPATTGGCGDIVRIILHSEPFFAITIKSREFAETYKSYFELLWNIAKSRR